MPPRGWSRCGALRRRSLPDPASRFLQERKGLVLGSTVTLAARPDPLIVEPRVRQEETDNPALRPRVEGVQQRGRQAPPQVRADRGFLALAPLRAVEKPNLDVYVPDSNLARVLNRGGRWRGRAKHPGPRRMRRKLRRPAGRATYGRRQALLEPGLGVLKEPRGMRQCRRRGLEKVAVEGALAATAYDLTRMWNPGATARKAS